MSPILDDLVRGAAPPAAAAARSVKFCGILQMPVANRRIRCEVAVMTGEEEGCRSANFSSLKVERPVALAKSRSEGFYSKNISTSSERCL